MPERPRLGHIVYSNCAPPHARLLLAPQPDDPVLVSGTPARLNRLLAEGAIDCAPSSSIEYARHADRYRLVPDLAIAARGPVHSVVLVSRVPPTELEDRVVALPTASATSIVLLKILCQRVWGVRPRFLGFRQRQQDPFAPPIGADAALFIGDTALRPGFCPPATHRVDLGQAWWEATGLPFVFALWQTTLAGPAAAALVRRLEESRGWGEAHRDELAAYLAPKVGVPASTLLPYWAGLVYRFGPEEQEGLATFYRWAAELGEAPGVPAWRWAV